MIGRLVMASTITLMLIAPLTQADKGSVPLHLNESMEAREVRRRLLGVLVYSSMTASYDGVPARVVINDFRRRTGIPIVARYDDDGLGYGIDPDLPIRLTMEETPALGVLESILDACSVDNEACTWQIRSGFVEVGTKPRLSVPAARERRLYYVRDLLLDIPTFIPGEPPIRDHPAVLAVELIGEIVENIEPGSWDWGQYNYDREDVSPKYSVPPAAGGGGGAPGGTGGVPSPRVPRGAQYRPPVTIAVIRYWRDVMIVDAPDYIHRRIDGYPAPIPPGAGRGGRPPIGVIRSVGDPARDEEAESRWLRESSPVSSTPRDAGDR